MDTVATRWLAKNGGKRPPANVPAVTYIMRDSEGQAWYIGQSIWIEDRMKAHARDALMRRHITNVQYIRCSSYQVSIMVQNAYIAILRPRWNTSLQ